MKIVKIIASIICISIIGIYSCKKKDKDLIDDNNKWVYLDTLNNANIKIVQVFAGNTPQLPTAPNATIGPQVFIYANGQKLNGLSLGYGSVWPTTNVYGNIPSGNVKFDIVNGRMDLTVVPNVPKFIAGDTLASFTTTLEKGKFYSMYIGDTVPTVRVTLKEDFLPAPDPLTYKLRVANFSMNNNPTDVFTVYSRRENRNILSNIGHKEVSDWTQIPVPILNDTVMFIRNITDTVARLTVTPNTALRMVTVVFRGKTGVTNKPPSAFLFLNL